MAGPNLNPRVEPGDFDVNSGTVDELNHFFDGIAAARANGQAHVYVIIDPKNPARLRLTEDRAIAKKHGNIADIVRVVGQISDRFIKSFKADAQYAAASYGQKLRFLRSKMKCLTDDFQNK